MQFIDVKEFRLGIGMKNNHTKIRLDKCEYRKLQNILLDNTSSVL